MKENFLKRRDLVLRLNEFVCKAGAESERSEQKFSRVIKKKKIYFPPFLCLPLPVDVTHAPSALLVSCYTNAQHPLHSLIYTRAL